MRIFYPAFDRAELIRTLRERLARLGAELPVVRAVLFGSWARGAQTVASDVDLLIVYRGEPRADAYARVKRALGVPRLEPHLYTEAEYAAAGPTVERMTRDGVVLLGPDPARDTSSAGPLEQRLRDFFAAETDGIIAVYLFGSVARGTPGARSDLDVAVLYAAPPPATLAGLPLDLERRLERLAGRPAQVVVLNTAPVGLVHRVLRDGVLLLDRDPSARIRFEVRARNQFVPDLIAQQLAFIETCVQELRTLARPAEIPRDVREARFVLHTLQIAIQAAIDVASHIVSDERLGEPETNRELFDRLGRSGWLSAELAATMGRMAGFRNLVVHGYGGVNLEIVRDIVEHRLDDLLGFVVAIRARLP